jgi:predicted PurR-regulated permease PerM
MTSSSRPPAARDPGAGEGPHEQIATRTVFLFIIGLAVFLYAIRWILLPFVLSAVAAYLCAPVIDWLASRTRCPRSLFAIAAFAVLLAIAAGIAMLGVPLVIRETMVVVTDLGGTIERLARGVIGDRSIEIAGQSMNASELAQAAVAALRDWLGQAGVLFTLASWSFAGLFGVFLTFVLLFYFLQSGPRLARGLFWLMPPEHRGLSERIWSRLDPILRRYFIGVIVVVLYAATAAYIGLDLFLGIEHALFLALLTAILEMIPVVGPAAAVVIAGLAAVRQATGIGAIAAYAVYATVLRLSIDQLLGPVVLGQAAKLHPILVIFCFLSGGLLFGIPGVIMAVPIALAIKATLATLYDEPWDWAAVSREGHADRHGESA